MLVLPGAILGLAACASQPDQVAPISIEKNRISSLVHKGDLVTYSLGPDQENSFCVTSVTEKDIHSTGPLVVPISDIQKLAVQPQGCNQKSDAFREAGRTARAALVTPFVLVCVASGHCSMK
jgi:hypothetical protein